jgi:hypothetical protein
MTLHIKKVTQSIIIIVSLFSLAQSTYAVAEDSFIAESRTTSVSVGQQLLTPEVGTQRLDIGSPSNPFTMEGSWFFTGSVNNWINGNLWRTNVVGDSVKFNLSNSDLLRIYCSRDSVSNVGGSYDVYVDGFLHGSYTIPTNSTLTMGLVVYQILNLNPAQEHTIEIKTTLRLGTYIGFDGFDVDDAGTVSVFDDSLDIVILDPDNTQMQDAVNDGYITIDNGTIDNTTQTTTQVQVTFQSNNTDAIFPTNTIITEATNQLFDFQSFITENVIATVQESEENAAGAVKLGVPGISLDFSNPVTVEITVSEAYNGMEMDILYQNDGDTQWTQHTTPTCTITNGLCIFTTDHATTYIVNGDGTISGLDDLNLNVEVNATLSMDCYDKDGSTGDYDVILGTVANPGIVIAGTPAVGESTCIVTTNDTQGYYLSMINDNGASNTTLVHSNNTDEIPDLTQFDQTTKVTESWNAPTTKGLGFSVIQFPQADTTNNTFDGIWTTSGNLCEEGITSDDADYAGVPQTDQAIAAHTAYNSTSTTTDVCYKVDVSPSQPSGVYTGSVTYTATSDASGFYQ